MFVGILFSTLLLYLFFTSNATNSFFFLKLIYCFGFQALNQRAIYCFSNCYGCLWVLFLPLQISFWVPKEKVFHSQRFSQKQNWKIHDTRKDIGIFKGIPSKHIDTFCKIWTLLTKQSRKFTITLSKYTLPEQILGYF